MLLLSAIVIGILVGLLTGGSLWQLGRLRFRHWPFLLAALVTQVIIFSSPLASSQLILKYGGLVYALTFAIVLAVLVRNFNIAGMKLVFLGTALNALVIVANGGQMPVDQTKLEIAMGNQQATEYGEAFINTAPMHEATRLSFLGDVILTPDFLPVRNVLSVGDLAIALGVATLLAIAMRMPAPPQAIVAEARRNVARIPQH